jgi:DNA-binding HxlR family transcriptional regulator
LSPVGDDPAAVGRRADEQIPITRILQLIDERDAASFRSLERELGDIATPAELAGTLKTALTEGLVTAHLSAAEDGELRYRLTPRGLQVLASSLAKADTVSLQTVLTVLADFDNLGGGSLGLVAWELYQAEEALAPAWARAIRERLLAPAGTDEVHGEDMWRLSERGWRTHDAAGKSSPQDSGDLPPFDNLSEP